MALKAAALVVAAATLLAGCAMPLLPADSIDPVHAAPAVEITFEQDASHRLLVRYQAPADVARLDFLLHDDRIDQVFRTPAMRPADGCGALLPGGLALRHGAGCERGAVFVVTPKAMALDALYEPAQPTSDGGVLFYTGFYAAAAPGLGIRWRFVPSAGDYGIDDSRRHDAAWQVAPGPAYAGPKAPADQRDDDAWLTDQHAQQYVFLGHTPMAQSGNVIWVRDPAVPRAIVDTIARAAPLAWDAYARGAARQPAGPVAIVMLSAPADSQFTWHGDRTEGQMLRLSFSRSITPSQASDAGPWSAFVAHEIAHLWNHGVFGSDQARPWLHEGDAEWVALNAMHEDGVLGDQAFVRELQSRLDSCLSTRGQRAAAMLSPGRGQDDPYGCGVALQLLGYAQVHGRHAEATPLAVWGALHRAHPMLESAGFAQFFDEGGAPTIGTLLSDPGTPFAPTYRADLGAWLPLGDSSGEPPMGDARRQLVSRLVGPLVLADCGRLAYTLRTHGDTGEIVLDPSGTCKNLPVGAHLTTVAGLPLIAQPRAAWRALQHACATGERFEAGFDGHAPVTLACPSPVPDLPPAVILPVLPDDVLARLGLTKKPS